MKVVSEPLRFIEPKTAEEIAKAPVSEANTMCIPATGMKERPMSSPARKRIFDIKSYAAKTRPPAPCVAFLFQNLRHIIPRNQLHLIYLLLNYNNLGKARVSGL